MYDWFDREAKSVKWGKFFVFQKDADAQTIDIIEKQFAPFPQDYKDYLFQYGESKLFRSLNHPSYNMGVFAHPRVLEGLRGELLLEIGFFVNGGYAHFRKKKGSTEPESG